MFGSLLIAAPMAGGTSTTALATAAASAGALGFLAAGYRSVQEVAEQIAATRAGLAGTSSFGVNVFVPGETGLDPAAAAALAAYRAVLEEEAQRCGASVGPIPQRLDDEWPEKIELLCQDPVPYVSFTFGLAPTGVVRRLQRAGSIVLASVTTTAEALAAQETGVDALVVQHPSAGGHSAAFLPAPGTSGQGFADAAELVRAVAASTTLPLVGAGGIGTPAQAKAALAAGARAVQLGTALVRTPESGARDLHKNALADPRYTETAVTRAFTGRPARALVNRFVREHSAHAPEAYPQVHFLTAGIRAAAAAAGDAGSLNLWAGTEWRHARADPARDVLAGFLKEL
ncbi:NAD(P)H-dependent flavin oxidoreductase [Arthrobacter sp. 35W]|uniref:NAD(P)H-dependent flavin oxidoreductase n=1 Tax=Arthrobacter sp. 35W TaxID=1132441 RepID=UPI00040A7A3D|nr:nitronate monooxygenase [Arthrobacter sp. 35W]